MVATHISHKLVFTARLFLKKASCGCCVLVLDSFGEPAVHPENSDSCVPGCSGTEFVPAHHVMRGGCWRYNKCSQGL